MIGIVAPVVRARRSALVSLVVCLLALAGCAGSAGQSTDSAAYPHPGALYSLSELAFLAELWRSGPPDRALEALVADARRAADRDPEPVEDFRIPAYYRQPDAHMAAKEALSNDARAAFALALASWVVEGPDRVLFRTRAEGILAAWAGRNRRVSGSDGDLVVCYAGIPLILAADLIWDEPGWQSRGDRERFSDWVRGVFLPSARRSSMRANNHGDWGAAASIASAYLLDEPAGVAADLENLKRRIDENIDARGELPHENRRTSSGMWYTYFALAPMTVTARVAENATGVDVFNHVSPTGRSLRLALDRYWIYCMAPEAWPYRRPAGLWGRIYTAIYPSAQEIRLPTARDWPGDLYEVMSAVYGVDQWSSWVQGSRPLPGVRGWIYPSVMRLALRGDR